MTEIERKWLLDVGTTDPVNVLVPNPKPTQIVQVYLDSKGLQDDLVRYKTRGQDKFALRVQIGDETPWIFEPDLWAGKVLSGAPGAIRVRSQLAYARCSPQHVLTIKGKGTMQRDELPDEILTEEVAMYLVGLPNLGSPVQKWRYAFWDNPRGGSHPYELDVFTKSLTGLVILEREFDTIEEATAFVLPSMFDMFKPREVTHDKRYDNLSLAVNGVPND